MMKKAVVLVNPYLCEEAELYQPRRIAEELGLLGVSARVLPNVGTAEIGREGATERLSAEYDFCVYLDKDKYAPRVLEKKGMRLFNCAEAVEICDDKALTHIALAGIVPMPETLFAPLCYKERAHTGGAKAIGEKLGYPVVVKECYGSLGKQVYLARDGRELAALQRRLKLRPHLYQKFIPESAGRDLRVICVGGKPVACMERISGGDFRSNLGSGGKGIARAVPAEAAEICAKTCSALRLDYCGIDLLFGKEGLMLCEVNSNAFFGGIERATGINVARIYAEYLAENG